MRLGIIHDQVFIGDSKRATIDSNGFLQLDGNIWVSRVLDMIQSILH